MNNEKIEELFATSARKILATNLDVLSRADQFWVKFYFDNVAAIKYRMGLPLHEVLSVDVSWKKLMWYMAKEEDVKAWEHHDELQVIQHDYGFGEQGDDEYGIEKIDFEEDISNEEREAREAVNEEGPPWDDCDDEAFIYKNKGL